MLDANKTQMTAPPTRDLNKTLMTSAPSLQATMTIKPVQCPVCKTFNPVGVMFCVDCGLIFDRALPDDAFGAPAVQLPVLVDPSGREHPLRPGATSIGRQGDIAFEDVKISRRHAEVTVQAGQIQVADLGSTNGTQVNGQPIGPGERRTLAAGDKLALGGVEFVLSLPGEARKTITASGGKTQAMSVAPTTQTAVAWLVFPDREVPLSPGKHVFGRRSESDIVISDPFVSGRHGVIEVDDEGVFLTDTGSTNGTLLNEARLEPSRRTQLGAGDTIRLGQLEIGLRFKQP